MSYLMDDLGNFRLSNVTETLIFSTDFELRVLFKLLENNINIKVVFFFFPSCFLEKKSFVIFSIPTKERDMFLVK